MNHVAPKEMPTVLAECVHVGVSYQWQLNLKANTVALSMIHKLLLSLRVEQKVRCDSGNIRRSHMHFGPRLPLRFHLINIEI